MPGSMVNEQSQQQHSQPQQSQRRQPQQQSGPSMPLVQGPPTPGPPQMEPFQPLPQPGSALTSRPVMPGLGKGMVVVMGRDRTPSGALTRLPRFLQCLEASNGMA